MEINDLQVENSSRSVFSSLQQAISDYLNTTSFTDDNFSTSERINCRLYLTVKSYEDDIITGELQIQSSRPVYNSSYETTVFNFRDSEIRFNYREYDPLIFSKNTMESQLTAILNFYAYIILALDYDTFSLRGGEEFYRQAAQILQMAQSSGETGWKMFENNRNRAAVLSAFKDSPSDVMRNILYEYHRQGMDLFSISPDKARATIAEEITNELSDLYSVSPMNLGITLFRDAKLDEIIDIFRKGSPGQKEKIISVLQEIYPTDFSKINGIKTN